MFVMHHNKQNVKFVATGKKKEESYVLLTYILIVILIYMITIIDMIQLLKEWELID